MNRIETIGRAVSFAQGPEVIKRDRPRMQTQHLLNVLRVANTPVGLIAHRVEFEGNHACNRGDPYTECSPYHSHRISAQLIESSRIDIEEIEIVGLGIGGSPSRKDRRFRCPGVPELPETFGKAVKVGETYEQIQIARIADVSVRLKPTASDQEIRHPMAIEESE